MRKIHKWNVLLLSDTRIHDERELPILEKSLGSTNSVWSLGTHGTFMERLGRRFIPRCYLGTYVGLPARKPIGWT
jgi:hypothetical protein